MDTQTESVEGEETPQQKHSDSQLRGRKLDKSTLIWVVLGAIIIGIAGLNLWSVFDTKSEVQLSKTD